jgi:hypothetical protein
LIQQNQVDRQKLHQLGARNVTGHDVAVEVEYRDIRIDFEDLLIQLESVW